MDATHSSHHPSTNEGRMWLMQRHSHQMMMALLNANLEYTFDKCNPLVIPLSLTKHRNDSIDLLAPDDDGTPGHQIGTLVCKCFDDIQHEKGKMVNHNHNDQLCQILCSDGEEEQMWCTKVKSHLHSTRNPKKVNAKIKC